MRQFLTFRVYGPVEEADIKMVTLKCSEGGECRLGLEEGIREGFPEEVMPKQCCEGEYL